MLTVLAIRELTIIMGKYILLLLLILLIYACSPSAPHGLFRYNNVIQIHLYETLSYNRSRKPWSIQGLWEGTRKTVSKYILNGCKMLLIK